MALELLLIRHGITEYNNEHRYQGWKDLPLCKEGREALHPKADWQTWADRVYVSPLRRAVETAEILFPKVKRVPMESLREFDFGAFDGRTYLELKDDPEYQAWVDGMCMGACPQGEDRDTFTKRVLRGFYEIAASEKEHTIIVAHGGTQMALLDALGNGEKDYYDYQLQPGRGYLLSWDGAHLTIRDTIDFTEDD